MNEINNGMNDGSYLTKLQHIGACKNDLMFEPDEALPFHAARIQLVALGLALFASTVAPFGGFAASATKRAFNIKDFDSLFPGHGGFTDRMDCQFIMGMAAWIAYTSFVQTEALVVPVGRMISSARLLNENDQKLLLDAVQSMLVGGGRSDGE